MYRSNAWGGARPSCWVGEGAPHGPRQACHCSSMQGGRLLLPCLRQIRLQRVDVDARSLQEVEGVGRQDDWLCCGVGSRYARVSVSMHHDLAPRQAKRQPGRLEKGEVGQTAVRRGQRDVGGLPRVDGEGWEDGRARAKALRGRETRRVYGGGSCHWLLSLGGGRVGELVCNSCSDRAHARLELGAKGGSESSKGGSAGGRRRTA